MLVTQSVALGGMETHCVDLAAEFVRRGRRVVAVIPEDEALALLAERFALAGAEVVRLNTDSRTGRLRQLANLARFARRLRRLRPAVVHLHTGGATGGAGVVALARLAGACGLVVTEHDVPAADAGCGQRLARRALDAFADTTVAVSRRNAGLRRARCAAIERKFAVVLNGVPIPNLPDELREEHRRDVRSGLSITETTIVFGSLVRLADGKGLPTLLEAFADVRREFECKLLLVGDGPLRAALAAQAHELGIEDDVLFAGEQRVPAPYLDAMDVFVLAVPAGSMSIALLEAMARGLPPIITFGGPEEAVIDAVTGLEAAPHDPIDLARAMRLLITDGALRHRLGKGAAAYVDSAFSVARVADDLAEVYGVRRASKLPDRLRAAAAPAPPSWAEPALVADEGLAS